MHVNTDALSRRPVMVETSTVTFGITLMGEPTKHHWRNTEGTDIDTALVDKSCFAPFYKPTAN